MPRDCDDVVAAVFYFIVFVLEYRAKYKKTKKCQFFSMSFQNVLVLDLALDLTSTVAV